MDADELNRVEQKATTVVIKAEGLYCTNCGRMCKFELDNTCFDAYTGELVSVSISKTCRKPWSWSYLAKELCSFRTHMVWL